MVKVIKYTAAIPKDTRAQCAEKLACCDKKASVHVCFEDGSGVSVCRECFDKHINEGVWITDSAEILLAS